MNTSYFLYLKRERRDQIFNLKTNKEKLIKEKEIINIELKKIKCFNWLSFKRVIINVITFGCLNKNKERNFNIKKLEEEIKILNRSINLINNKIEKLENNLITLKNHYFQQQKIKSNLSNLTNQSLASENKVNSPKI